jgi:hypothetical protein
MVSERSISESERSKVVYATTHLRDTGLPYSRPLSGINQFRYLFIKMKGKRGVAYTPAFIRLSFA